MCFCTSWRPFCFFFFFLILWFCRGKNKQGKNFKCFQYVLLPMNSQCFKRTCTQKQDIPCSDECKKGTNKRLQKTRWTHKPGVHCTVCGCQSWKSVSQNSAQTHKQPEQDTSESFLFLPLLFSPILAAASFAGISGILQGKGATKGVVGFFQIFSIIF